MIYTEYNTKVVDAYKYTDLTDLVNRIINYRKENGLPITREFNSYLNEIKVHIWLYKLHYKIDRTKDADLEENISKGRERIYNFLGDFL